MSNRFATISLIVIVSILSAGIFFVVGLFLFPGITMFGLRYIGPNTHKYSKKVILTEMGKFSNIVINTYEIPVEVVFSATPEYTVIYYDNFNGVTNSTDIKEPSLTAEIDSNGQAVITTHEYHKCVYESSTSLRFIKLYIPFSDVNSNSSSTKWSLTINSNKSDVYFAKNADVKGWSGTPEFHKLSITTNGQISYNVRLLLNDVTEVLPTKVLAQDFHFTTNNTIEVDKDKTKIVDATNYTLNSLRGNINISCYTPGNLDLTTNQGYIKLVSCNDLKISTVYGSIGYGGEDEGGSILVHGKADINSHAGSVTIGTISGANSSIVTTSGNVKINTLKGNNSTIVTKRGFVEIGKATTLKKVETNIGKVTIKEASGDIDVKTNRGNIYLGSDTTEVNNVTAFSRIGKINVKSANGAVKIETISSEVIYINGESSDIFIKSGGKLTAKGLKGKVTIEADKNVELDFANITLGKTEITLNDGCVHAKIDALNNKPNEVHYYMKGAYVKTYEYYNNQPRPQEHGASIDNASETENMGCEFKVIGTKANIEVTFKSSDAE